MKKNNVEGDHHPPPRAFQEKNSFSFVKDALGDALEESLKAKEHLQVLPLAQLPA